MTTLEPYQLLTQRLEHLCATHERYTMRSLGLIPTPFGEVDFWRLDVAAASDRPLRMCLSAGIHGDEPAGVEALLAFLSQPDLPEALAIACFPCLNPVGWLLGQREDEWGTDLNRTFDQETPPDNIRLFRDSLLGESFDLCIDLHEDYDADGFYLYEAPQDEANVGLPLTATFQAEGIPLEVMSPYLGYVAMLPEEMPQDRWPQQVWAYQTWGCRCLTLETPTYRALSERVAIHLAAIDFVLGAFRPATKGEWLLREGLDDPKRIQMLDTTNY